MDWDDAYDNVGHIPDAASYPPMWAARAQSYREAAAHCELDIAYGEDPREQLDIFRPAANPKGLVIYVHGGYWIRLDRSFWSHLAEGALQHGWAVAIPSYPLTPQVRIRDITRSIAAAVSQAAKRVDGPLRLVGHSAGGQLVTRMRCDDSPLAGDILARIEHILSISGVHDLRPLLNTTMNQTLGLDTEEAEAESPCLQQPLPGTRLTAWVGGDERPEFIRQTRLICDAWGGMGAQTKALIDPGHHHFSVIAALAEPDSQIVQALLDS